MPKHPDDGQSTDATPLNAHRGADAQMRLRDELSALAVGLCQDAGVSLEADEESEQWSWDPLRKVIRLPVSDLLQRGGDWCAGRLVNEIGHFWLTRHELMGLDFPNELLGRLLLDSLEDARVNAWMISRYPGARVWLEAVHDSQDVAMPPFLPPFLQFILACTLAAGRDWAPSPTPLAPAVEQALDATREARQRYAAILPASDLTTVPVDVRIRYQDDVLPELMEVSWFPPPFEQSVQLHALEALRLAEAEIFPHAEALLAGDLEKIANYLSSNPMGRHAMQDVLEHHGAEAVMREVSRSTAEACLHPPWAKESAERVMEELAQAHCEGACGGLCEGGKAQGWGGLPAHVDGAEGGQMGAMEGLVDLERTLRPVHDPDGERFGRLGGGWGASGLRKVPLPVKNATPYDRALQKIHPQIAALTAHLDEILLPRRRSHTQSGYPSGRRVDLRRLMAFEADPRLYNKLWLRTSIPERRETSISLLVDLSGSMQGDKAHAALLGSILLAETLSHLEVPFAVNGFQDQVIPFIDFADPFDAYARSQLAQMPLETEDARPGGHNQCGNNDDGPCVMQAAEALREQPADIRLLIVVSDGQPAGLHSSEDDLRRTIALLSEPHAGIELVGIGLGPDTEHVNDYYPRSSANVPTAQFATEIGGLIEEALLQR